MGLETPSDFFARGLKPRETMQQPLFAHCSQAPPGVDGGKGGETGEVNFTALFRRAKTHEERSVIVAQALQRRLARALGIESKDIDVEKPLHAYGVDSLVAIELASQLDSQ